MSTLIVIAFDNMEEAEQVRDTLRKGEAGGHISLDDSAIVVRNQDGKVHVKNEVDRGVKVGAMWGSVIGLLVTGIFFPILGVALGAAGGAVLGKMLGNSVDSKFTKEVAEHLQPGTSAIFFIFRGDDPSAAIAALRPYSGTILQTTLTAEAEASLRDELKTRIK